MTFAEANRKIGQAERRDLIREILSKDYKVEKTVTVACYGCTHSRQCWLFRASRKIGSFPVCCAYCQKKESCDES